MTEKIVVRCETCNDKVFISYPEWFMYARGTGRKASAWCTANALTAHGIEIVDGCNAVYIYQGDVCRCAGADTTVEDLESFLVGDPIGFLEAYNLEEGGCA